MRIIFAAAIYLMVVPAIAQDKLPTYRLVPVVQQFARYHAAGKRGDFLASLLLVAANGDADAPSLG